MNKIFVDGQEGTTGLEIRERLAGRTDLQVLTIDLDKRKDVAERRRLLNEADIAFLCLPDGAAREAVALVENDTTRIIDASTAFRTAPDWAYGLPELNAAQRARIAAARRVSVPGCHATAALLGLCPLLQAGVMTPDYPVVIFSLTGYSGGGRKLIEKYQDPDQDKLRSPKPYALGLTHKHVPEIHYITGLTQPPILVPVVDDYYRGLAVTLPLDSRLLQNGASARDIHALLSAHYADARFVRVMPFGAESNLDAGYFDVEACNHTNRADIGVFGQTDRFVVMVRLDNLGKGASGAAVQNMNIMLGMEEGTGLT
jgi:N-acetyl-gamma-glutamyl-phosphate reductase